MAEIFFFCDGCMSLFYNEAYENLEKEKTSVCYLELACPVR